MNQDIVVDKNNPDYHYKERGKRDSVVIHAG